MVRSMLVRSAMVAALAITAITVAAPAVASAGACATSVASAEELHSSITNPACEGRVIRIKPGTYVPQLEFAAGDARSRTFNVTVNDLTLKGAGGLNTILSGDLGASGDTSDNAYHVVVIDTTLVNAIRFENIAIVDGNADIDDGPVPCPEDRGIGGGIKFCDPSAGSVLALDGVTVADNYALFAGAGVLIAPSFVNDPSVMSQPPRVVIDHARFENNLAGIEPTEGQPGGPGQGAGLAAIFTDVDVAHSTFVNNRAGFAGGGMETIESAVSVRHSEFIDNTAVATSGAFRILGWDPAIDKDSTISNNVFENNRLIGVDERGRIFQRGGAILVEGYANPDTSVAITNNAFIGNSSVGVAGALEVVNANALVSGNRFRGNAALGGSGGALQVTTLPLEFRGGLAAPAVTVTGNNFDDNTTATIGGALTLSENFVPPAPLQSTFEITNNRFRRNQAAESGGALAVDAQLVVTSKNRFIENRAEGISSLTGEPTGNGGAIVATSMARHSGAFQFLAPIIAQDDLTELISTLVIDDSTFVGNYALKDGGAVSDDQAVTGSIFVPGPVDPTATFTPTGPGLARITASNSVFTQNVADQGVGGAIAITGEGQHENYVLTPFTPGVSPWVADPDSAIIPSMLDLSGNRILNNTAGTDGGGVFVTDVAELNTFTNNNIRSNAPNNCSGCT